MRNLILTLKHRYGILFPLSVLFFGVSNAFAYDVLPGSGATTMSLLITNVICEIAYFMFYVLAALVVLFVVVAAYKYLTSSGDPEKVKGATKTITYAVVALVVALLAKVIPLIVVNLVAPDSTIALSDFCG